MIPVRLTQQMLDRAFYDLEQRRLEAPKRWPKLRNEDLYAGEPMIYYCQMCEWPSDILHEGWFLSRPRKLCSECQVLHDYIGTVDTCVLDDCHHAAVSTGRLPNPASTAPALPSTSG